MVLARYSYCAQQALNIYKACDFNWFVRQVCLQIKIVKPPPYQLNTIKMASGLTLKYVFGDLVMVNSFMYVEFILFLQYLVHIVLSILPLNQTWHLIKINFISLWAIPTSIFWTLSSFFSLAERKSKRKSGLCKDPYHAANLLSPKGYVPLKMFPLVCLHQLRFLVCLRRSREAKYLTYRASMFWVPLLDRE